MAWWNPLSWTPARAGMRPALQKRASAIGRLLFVATGGKTLQRSPVRYDVLAREGYQANAIVYRCIRLVADGLKATPIMLMQGEKDVTKGHPLAAVLASPNPQQVWEELIDAVVGHLFLGGETFLEGVTIGRELREIYALRPDTMTIEPAEDGSVGAFVYESAGGQKRFDITPRRFSPILHLKHWHPTEHWRGLPPMAPAAGAGDEHNAAVGHAKALYQNSARPSGALVYAPKEGSDRLTDDQFERLKFELTEEHSGPTNAGKPFVLDGGLTWEQMGFSPKDMESGEGRAAAAREIALALGVPPLLLGLPGDNTFSNYYEGKIALWEHTIWPLATLIAAKLTSWVRPLYPDITVAFDRERSPMAEAQKRDRWERLAKADFLTLDEKRAELGYPALPNKEGAVVLVSAGLSTLADVIAPPEPPPELAGVEAYGPGGEKPGGDKSGKPGVNEKPRLKNDPAADDDAE